MTMESYAEANAAFARIDQQVSDLAKMVKFVGQTLELNRSVFSFSNTPVGMPAEVHMISGNPSVDGNHWQSATQIMKLLAEWHKAKDRVRNEWHALSADQQGAMQPPPPIVKANTRGRR